MFSKNGDQRQDLAQPRGRNDRLLRSVVIVVFALVLSAGAWRLLAKRSAVDQGIAALNRAYRSWRPLEARISGFDYAPLAQTRGGGQDAGDYVGRERAERLLLDAFSEDSGPAARHALGRLYLTRKEFGKAVDQFTRALEATPQNAPLHNDQGVALMSMGEAATAETESHEEVEQLAAALEHFNHALALDPSLPDAVFNRALLYQRMLLPQQARDEWQRYLKQDSTSHWAGEARRNLQRMEEVRQQPLQTPAKLLEALGQARRRGDDNLAWDIINQHRDRIGSLVIPELLDNYLSAISERETGASVQLLETLSYAGALEERFTGDRFIGDLAAFYRRNASARQADLTKARGWLKSGQKQFDLANTEDAKGLFAQAKQLFSRIGDVGESLQAEYMWAHCHRKQTELGLRSAVHRRLSQVCAKLRYKWLLTWTLMAEVSMLSGLANYSAVIELSQRGLRMAQANEDTNAAVRFLLQAADSHDKIGNYHQSLKLYHDGLTLVNRRPVEPLLRVGIYMTIALPLNSLGRHAAAAEYQREALRLAREMGRPSLICRSHINYALTQGLLRNYEEATRNAQIAFDVAKDLKDGISRSELLVLASIKLGKLYGQSGDFNKASENFNRAISLYGGLDDREYFEYSAHKGLLTASLAQGGSQALEEEIGSTLELFEKHRAKILEESNRNSFFDNEQSIYDIAIDFWHTRKSDDGAAFEIAERCRARSLLDLVSGAPRAVHDAATPDLRPERVAPPLTLAEIQARMPEKAQIVQYAALEDKVVMWVVSGARPIIPREQKISGNELNELIKTFLQLVAKSPAGSPKDNRPAGPAAAEIARRLYGLLIEPIAPFLDRGKQLCIVPDKALNQLPYAALISPESGRFLIEDYSLLFAPSATMFVICSETAALKDNGETEKLLSVGNPTFDRKAFPLPDLPSARREAEVILSYYRRSRKMIGEEATKRRLESEIGRYDILHLAMHCIVNEHSPMLSQLLMAAPKEKGFEADGVLQAHEIYRLPLSRLRLVILSACRSGVERYYGGEGMVGVSRPFIAKGVPLVVASLWEVDPDATTELMIRFHEYRKLKTLPTADALREAQLSLLHGSDSSLRQPYYWASFVSIGGYANY
jgi:CHAT domain-containing protein/tetratricopeptide (TPR) repeat protein